MTDIAKLEVDLDSAEKALSEASRLNTVAWQTAESTRTAFFAARDKRDAALLALDETRINGYAEIDRRGSRVPRIVTIRGKTAYARKPGELGHITTYAYNLEKPNGPWHGVARPTAKDSYAGPGKLYLEETK